MSVLEVKPVKLYPHSRQFPFDEVAEKIVRAMEARNWKVPGINVDFYDYGSGEAKYRMVSCIKGEDFILKFSRIQAHIDFRMNDIAALSDICIPKQIINVYSDESGPRYYLYVGTDWEEDKDWFMTSIKVNSKLLKEPRRYLVYKGNTHMSRADKLLPYTDLDREYSPGWNDPKKIDLEQKFEEFTSYLEKSVLEYILAFPETSYIEEPVIDLIPYEGPWPIIFSVCSSQNAERILKGMKNKNELPLWQRHAAFGNWIRLVSLDVSCDASVPKIARDGFIWCCVNQNITPDSQVVDIPHQIYMKMGTIFDKEHIIAVRLKYANGVYVADNYAYERTREKLFEAITPRTCLTEDELGEALVARGATIVPITEYKGGYRDPIVLINRELDFEEIEWIANT